MTRLTPKFSIGESVDNKNLVLQKVDLKPSQRNENETISIKSIGTFPQDNSLDDALRRLDVACRLPIHDEGKGQSERSIRRG